MNFYIEMMKIQRLICYYKLMQVLPVNNSTQTPLKKRFPTVKATGYGAFACAIASGIAGHNKKIKLHKYLAYIAGILTLAHIGIIEKHYLKKSQKK